MQGGRVGVQGGRVGVQGGRGGVQGGRGGVQEGGRVGVGKKCMLIGWLAGGVEGTGDA